MIDHDVKPGALRHCQICGSDDLQLCIDLGHQPLCDALLNEEQLNEPEVFYPLRLMQCKQCTLAQLDYVVNKTEVYPQDYPYRAGISWPVVAAHKAMAEDLVARYGKGLCVDVGCNDGTLLSMFQLQGCTVLGFEPTNVAAIANEAGVPTVQAFFTEDEAKHCTNKAHIITFTNVFAHMADLGEVMRGVCRLLDKDGVLVIENHYLLDIIQGVQFDSIYHEHVRTYTLQSLANLFGQYGLEIFHAERVERYGGNIRVHVAWKGSRPVDGTVMEMRLTEVEAGITDRHTWQVFRNRIDYARECFRYFVCENGPLVACSAPGRASTLLNYFGVSAKDIRYTGELEGSLKLGKYLPGCHIPVLTNKRFLENEPSNIVLLAWHYGKEIARRLKREGVHSRLWVPLPRMIEI